MPANGAAASYGDLLVTSLVVLGGVCIAAFVVVRLVGRFLATGRVRGAHLMDVVARVPLEPRRSLYVVEVAGKTLLVGTSEMGLSVLSELDGAVVRSRTPVRQSFGELVRAAWLRRRSASSTQDTAPGNASLHATAIASPSTRDETSLAASDASAIEGRTAATPRAATSLVSSDASANARDARRNTSVSHDATGVAAGATAIDPGDARDETASSAGDAAATTAHRDPDAP